MSSCRIPKMYQPSHSKKKMPTLYFVLKFCLDEEFIIQSSVVLFQAPCRIKILYQIALKATDKCEDLAKYIYINNSMRNLGFLTFFFFSRQHSSLCSDLWKWRPWNSICKTSEKLTQLWAFEVLNCTNYSTEYNDLARKQKKSDFFIEHEQQTDKISF